MLITKGSTPKIPFLLVDATDDETAETGITPASITVKFQKDGGSSVTATNTPVESGDGMYYIIPTATESNTLGGFTLIASASGTNVFREVHQVVAYDVDKEMGDQILSYTDANGVAIKEMILGGMFRVKFDITAGTLTVYDTDGTTTLFTATVTTATSNPIQSGSG